MRTFSTTVRATLLTLLPWAAAAQTGVGIGIATPSALLDVNGSTRLRGLTAAGVVTTDASGNLSSSTATTAFGSSFIQNQSALQSANFNVSGSGGVGVLGIGLGTTAPTQSLDVNGGARIGGGTFSPVTTQGGYLQWNRSFGEGETFLLNQRGAAGDQAGIRFGGVTTTNVVTEWARFQNNGYFGVGTAAPSSTLHSGGSVAVGIVNGLAGSNSGTPLGDRGYVGLSPANGADYYLLPAASTCPGRIYYVRNNSSTNTAYLGTGTGSDGGSIYEGGSTSSAAFPYFIQASGLTKTLTIISDGTNWTLIKSGN